MTKTLTRWFVCRAGWWNNAKRPARHDWEERPGMEAPIFHCRRCDRLIGF
jgi:hypothetical protein